MGPAKKKNDPLSDRSRALNDQIAALDLNPVAVLPHAQGVCVLDALLIRTCDTEPRP